MTYPSLGKSLEEIGKEIWKGDIRMGGVRDHIITHFQCDLCHFLNMKGRDPTKGSNKDEILIIFIRRSSINSFWSREPRTVRGDLTMLSNMGKIARE